MRRLLPLLLAGPLLLVIEAAWAQSTINPAIPAQDAPLASAPIRANFAAAYADENTLFSDVAALNTLIGKTQTCFSGLTAPNPATQFQCWWDTADNPPTHNYFDGTVWVSDGMLNTLTHTWIPSSQTSNFSANYLGTGTQPAVTAYQNDWDAFSPGAAITFPLPANPTDTQCVLFNNNTNQTTYPMIIAGNGNVIGPEGDVTLYSVVPGSVKVCFGLASGYWSQS